MLQYLQSMYVRYILTHVFDNINKTQGLCSLTEKKKHKKQSQYDILLFITFLK